MRIVVYLHRNLFVSHLNENGIAYFTTERSLIQVDWKLPLISDEDIFQAQIDRLENLSDTLEG